jgi:hypothetical protein
MKIFLMSRVELESSKDFGQLEIVPMGNYKVYN